MLTNLYARQECIVLTPIIWLQNRLEEQNMRHWEISNQIIRPYYHLPGLSEVRWIIPREFSKQTLAIMIQMLKIGLTQHYQNNWPYM